MGVYFRLPTLQNAAEARSSFLGGHNIAVLVDRSLSTEHERNIAAYLQADLCQGSKNVRDPGFAESKVWDLDGSWTLHVLFCRGTLETQDLKIVFFLFFYFFIFFYLQPFYSHTIHNTIDIFYTVILHVETIISF